MQAPKGEMAPTELRLAIFSRKRKLVLVALRPRLATLAYGAAFFFYTDLLTVDEPIALRQV